MKFELGDMRLVCNNVSGMKIFNKNYIDQHKNYAINKQIIKVLFLVEMKLKEEEENIDLYMLNAYYQYAYITIFIAKKKQNKVL